MTGNFTQTSAGTLNDQIGGTSASLQFGQVAVSGTATLAGIFHLDLVNGFLETLSEMREPDPELLRRSLTLMTEQTVRMHRLVEDLLTLSRLESTHNPVREEFVDIPVLALDPGQRSTQRRPGLFCPRCDRSIDL